MQYESGKDHTSDLDEISYEDFIEKKKCYI